jgi:hypothetical protein
MPTTSINTTLTVIHLMPRLMYAMIMHALSPEDSKQTARVVLTLTQQSVEKIEIVLKRTRALQQREARLFDELDKQIKITSETNEKFTALHTKFEAQTHSLNTLTSEINAAKTACEQATETLRKQHGTLEKFSATHDQLQAQHRITHEQHTLIARQRETIEALTRRVEQATQAAPTSSAKSFSFF